MSEDVVEICAGAGGQALGLERAGFAHALAVELDAWPVATLRRNRPAWDVRQGDVADPTVWDPTDYEGVDLLAGGVPCPPFSIAGKQRGASDERDLFAWAIELTAQVQPRALMLENVRGLSMPRFSAYRQAVLDRLSTLGYVADWKLLHASDFGIPQLRPRFILVALQPEYVPYFSWPAPVGTNSTVGEVLRDLMSENGWPHAEEWAKAALDIAPTVVGGSKKHGGADLGPTRARQAWSRLHVDGRGLADAAPGLDHPHYSIKPPRLTVEMVARVQGWTADDAWEFSGRKTAQYRQIGNAFPPPLATSIGEAILNALRRTRLAAGPTPSVNTLHDPIYRALQYADGPLTICALRERAGLEITHEELKRKLQNLAQDFEMTQVETEGKQAYSIGQFRAFTGQLDHNRHHVFLDAAQRRRVS